MMDWWWWLIIVFPLVLVFELCFGALLGRLIRRGERDSSKH
jgi:hypothetical protein